MRNLIAVVLAGLLALIGLVVFMRMSQSRDVRPVAERADTTAADRAAIDRLRDAYQATFTAGDVDGHVDLYAEDARVLRNANSILVGREAIRAAAQEGFSQLESEFHSSSEQVELMGDVAFDQGTFELTQTSVEGGETNVFYGSYVLISRRQSDGSWKISRYIWNNRPGPPVDR